MKATEGFSDTAFRSNLSEPIHNWVPWIGGYSANFVRHCIEAYVPDRGMVLDPFCGVGTTLVEASKAGCDSVGIELNPFAALAAQVKTSATNIDVRRVRSLILRLEENWTGLDPHRQYPAAFRTREPFFNESNLEQVNRLLNWIDCLPKSLEVNLLRIAVGSILVSISNYSYEPSLSTRSRAGRPPVGQKDVLSIFTSRVQSMLMDVDQEVEKKLWPDAKIVVGNSMDLQGVVPAGSIDLLLTSPPYLNNYHYVRNTRPHLYMLGLIGGMPELNALQEGNFGKYWQTVRERPAPTSLVHSPSLSVVLDQLALPSKNESKAYGGIGWRKYMIHYFNDCLRLLQLTELVLKPSGTAVFVLGDSYIQGVHVPAETIFQEISGSLGLKCIDCERVRYRNGGSTVRARKAANENAKPQLSEFVVVLKKLHVVGTPSQEIFSLVSSAK